MHSPMTLAQSTDLSMLGMGLSGDFSESVSGDENVTPTTPEERDEDEKIMQDRKFSDKNYGYRGGKNFNNPPQSKFSDEILNYFGYNYFLDQPSTYAPLNNVPIPPNYLIGPNDNIKIILFGNNNKKYELKVTRDGDIYIPEIGPIYVAGITFENLRALILETVNTQMTGTQVTVTLGSLRSIDVFILGAANNPGMYSISALSTLTNAIFKSGGIDISGSLRDIKLKRNGKIITNFDFYDLLLNGDTSNDIRLMQGDVVFIDLIGRTAGIQGEVNRPSIYELKRDENLGDLIRYAGGLKPKANRKSAEITRINTSENSFALLPIDLHLAINKDLELNNGDVVSIYPVRESLKNAVLISGHAQQPGFYSWKKGMRIGDIFKSPDDLLEMTDLNYILIKRKDSSSQDYSFLQVDLQKLFHDASSDLNIVLSNHDEILLLPSLLSPDFITTKLIQDQYIFNEETKKLILENEWTSLTYLRKSLMEDTLDIEEQNSIFNSQNRLNPNIDEQPDIDIRRYYEYSIFDYCIVPEDLAILSVEESGFRAKKSVPLDKLEKLKTPQDFISLQKVIEQERVKIREKNSDEDVTITITNICRQQLLDPILNIVNRDNLGDKLSLVSVFGSVHFPGSYPFTENMTLSDAIKAAGGPKNGTYNSEIELSSLNNSDKKFSTSNNFSSMQEAEKVKLNKMDTINLKQISSELRTVEISGEIYFPGVYPLSENQTLAELLRRAGGITEFGSAQAAYFQRESLKQAEKERLKSAQSELSKKIILSSQAGGLGQGSFDNNSITQLTALIVGDVDEVEALGRLVIDLDGILTGDAQDVVLEDGDSIYIPNKKQSVSVIGEVFTTNSHIYEKKFNINDYINLSGGATRLADEANIYLIKSDGSIVSPSQLSSGFFRSNQDKLLQPGDTIVVPLQIMPFSGVKATTEITQIIYQMALAAAAVNSF